MPADPEPTLAEWVVLALVVEGPKHGFAVAALTGRDGAVGRVWLVPRPIVYRSLQGLLAKELVRESGTEPGDRGPDRTVLSATARGRRATASWLQRPVAHVRDVRSELLVKLALLDRRGQTNAPLVAAQRAVVEPMAVALRARLEGLDGFARTIALWRSESAQTVLRFLDELDA